MITKITICLLFTLSLVNSYSQTPIKRVLVEENTGTWCSSCAYGSIYFKHVEENYPNAIPVAIHNGSFNPTPDPMAIQAYEIYMLDYYSGSPTFLFDRTDFPENPGAKAGISASNTWEHGLDTLDYYMDKVYNEAPLATVGIEKTYDATTRLVTVTITANFIENTTGDFRLNCFVVEDSVTGGSDYDQANSNFSGWTGSASYLQPLVDQPALITGYSHGHVLRAMLGNPEGVTAAIPTTVSDGDSYSKEFTYTLPTGYDPEQISLVGVVQRYGANKVEDREIVNANSQHLLTSGTNGVTEQNQFLDLNIYPNPINAQSALEFYINTPGYMSCSIYNLQGRIVKEVFNQDFTQGEYRIELGDVDLNSGTYFLHFSQGQNNRIERLIIE